MGLSFLETRDTHSLLSRCRDRQIHYQAPRALLYLNEMLQLKHAHDGGDQKVTRKRFPQLDS